LTIDGAQKSNCVRHNRSCAFTLIEILVAISIIALLLAMLMPVLGRVREKGRSVVCSANLRRLSVSHVIYTDMHTYSPPFRLTRASPTDPAVFVNSYGREQPRWQWFLDQGIGPVIDPTPWVKSPGDTFGDPQTLIMTNDYFICPSFNHPAYMRDIRNGSYGYNYQYLGNSRIIGGKFPNYPVHKLKIRRPSETVLIADGRGAGVPHGLHSYTLDPPKIAWSVGATSFGFQGAATPADQHAPAEARHDNRANVSFVDGHVESKILQDLGYVLDSAGVVVADHIEGSNRLWSGTGSDEPD
jgi:prepilin-type processing-associated H-X9-DG protein/prepilin-type N-terminal cleavage/methylation domain-containing protein